MRPKTDRVKMTDEERVQFLLLIRQGKIPARALRRAHILLRAAEGAFDHESTGALYVSLRTVQRVRQRFAEASLEDRLDRAFTTLPRPGSHPKLDAHGEAFLVALACSQPPEKREHWTMQLLADRLVELGIIEAMSDETVRCKLEKTLKPWQKEQWCIPAVDAAFVACMEDVLDLYSQRNRSAYRK